MWTPVLSTEISGAAWEDSPVIVVSSPSLLDLVYSAVVLEYFLVHLATS